MTKLQSIEKLIKLNLSFMANTYKAQASNPNISELSFDERFAMLIDSELDNRKTKRIKNLIKNSNMKINSSLESIDYSSSRGLNKGQIASLGECTWITKGNNIIINGATGTGKTYLACALGKRACELDFHVLYYRLPRLLSDLEISKSNSTYNRLMNQIKKCNVLIIDDFALARLSISESRELLEVIDDRNTNTSCIFVSQIPSSNWYEIFDDPTFADAIMDRIIHNSYKIELKGPSMRKLTANLEEI